MGQPILRCHERCLRFGVVVTEDDRILLTFMILRTAEYAIGCNLYARRILDFFFVFSRPQPDLNTPPESVKVIAIADNLANMTTPAVYYRRKSWIARGAAEDVARAKNGPNSRRFR